MKELIEKLKHNWKPFCKLRTDEQDLLMSLLEPNKLVLFNKNYLGWQKSNTDVISSDCWIVYRIHESYQPQEKDPFIFAKISYGERNTFIHGHPFTLDEAATVGGYSGYKFDINGKIEILNSPIAYVEKDTVYYKNELDANGKLTREIVRATHVVFENL